MEIRESRRFLKWLNDKNLAELLRVRCADPAIREQLLAEVAFRLWLYVKAGSDRRSLLYEIFDTAWQNAACRSWPAKDLFINWLEKNSCDRLFILPEEFRLGEASRFGRILQKRLDSWKNANGVIPFISLRDDFCSAVLMPFFIHPASEAELGIGRVLAGDGVPIKGVPIKGVPIKGLHDSLIEAQKALSASSFMGAENISPIDIWIPDIMKDSADCLRGRSAGLPLFFALLNYYKDVELKPFSYAASGVISQATGHPDPTAQEAKDVASKVDLLREVGTEQIIISGSLEACDQGEDLMRCDSFESLEHAVELQKSISSQQSTVQSLSAGVIERRLVEIDREMKLGALLPLSAKGDIVELIELLGSSIDPLTSEIRSEAEVLLAGAECHLGNAGASAELIEKALSNHDALGELSRIRALIRQAVNLGDFGKYEEATLLLKEALQSTSGSRLRNIEKRKLELDIHGTWGQILTCHGLRDPNLREQAYDKLQMACELARSLDSFDLGAESRELPQDLCYLYQWHAFFDRSQCRTVWDEFEKVTPMNHPSRNFMKRLFWLAAYRALLDEEDFEWQPNQFDLPSSEDGRVGSWLYQLSLKYRGALRVASGAVQEGRSDLQTAADLIPKSKGAPILQFIGVSSALEACRVLHEVDPQEASRFELMARNTLDDDLAGFHHAAYSEFLTVAGSRSGKSLHDVLYCFPY